MWTEYVVEYYLKHGRDPREAGHVPARVPHDVVCSVWDLRPTPLTAERNGHSNHLPYFFHGRLHLVGRAEAQLGPVPDEQ